MGSLNHTGGWLSEVKEGTVVPRLVRYWDRVSASPADYTAYPPIMANAFPGSGQNLLIRVLSSFPGTKHYGNTISSASFGCGRLRSDKEHIRMITKVAPGEIIGARMRYQKDRYDVIASLNISHFFIYRDLRDLVVYDALDRLDHSAHGNTGTVDGYDSALARIKTSIEGISDGRLKLPFFSIDKRFEAFNGWIGKPDVCAVKYEELVGPQRETTLMRMVDFYSTRIEMPLQKHDVIKRALDQLLRFPDRDSESNRVGLWGEFFTPDLTHLFEIHAGRLNRQLGYD